LGYTWSNPVKYIRSLRGFLSIQQALVFSRYPNPEVSMNGLNGLSEGRDAAAYPIPRIFSFGLNLDF
jgi:TonB-dependent starch-binding outer membrane protein SusC